MRVIQSVYNRFVRPHSPRVWKCNSGIAVRGRLLDISTWYPSSDTYKPVPVQKIRERVGYGDHVTEVGTGHGVFSALCATQSQRLVRSFDGSGKQIDQARELHYVMGVDNLIDVTHAVVGSGGNVWSGSGGSRLEPSDLPVGDVLVLDCEGAEVSILRGLSEKPRCVLVETHKNHGASTPTVCAALRELGLVIDSVDQMGESWKHFVVGVSV